ncbi:MAG: TIGR02710 family CRISPR-associated CARF protein, partial [Candidatus Eremiobacterota bacterium]
MNNALIITVGTSPEPVIFSLNRIQPDMVVYLCTGNEAGKNNGSIEYLDKICREYSLSPSKMKCLEVRDNPSCIGELCLKFYEGYRWLRNAGYSDEQIVCDPTAGRKWMSAAATMVASQLGLDMFYVDAKWDKGKVVENSMQVVSLGNPYEQTGFVEIERGRMLFNRYFYVSSGEIFNKLKERTHNSTVRDLYLCLEKISKAFQDWDNFVHYSRDIKPDFMKGINALERYILSASNVPSELVEFKNKLLSRVELLDEVNELKRKFGIPEPDIKITVDLVKNAERRVIQGRYDDAVARLYRAFESIEQLFLWKNYGINAA